MQKVIPIAEEYAKGRMSLTLEGGYDLTAQSNSIVNVVSILSGGSIVYDDDDYPDYYNRVEFTENKLIPYLQELLQPYWKNL